MKKPRGRRLSYANVAATLALVFAMSGDLPFGTLASPGAGMMPKLVLGLLIAFGAILVARAGESPPLATINWGDFRHAATVVAVTSRTSGTEAGSTTREW